MLFFLWVRKNLSFSLEIFKNCVQFLFRFAIYIKNIFTKEKKEKI